MKRWLLVLLTVLLPLQLAWANVADYCGDAHQVSSAHGSHQHAALDPADDDVGDAGTEFDCGHCHGHSAAILLRLELSRLPQHSLESFAMAPVRTTRPPSPRPERPQWQPLA